MIVEVKILIGWYIVAIVVALLLIPLRQDRKRVLSSLNWALDNYNSIRFLLLVIWLIFISPLSIPISLTHIKWGK